MRFYPPLAFWKTCLALPRPRPWKNSWQSSNLGLVDALDRAREHCRYHFHRFPIRSSLQKTSSRLGESSCATHRSCHGGAHLLCSGLHEMKIHLNGGCCPSTTQIVLIPRPDNTVQYMDGICCGHGRCNGLWCDGPCKSFGIRAAERAGRRRTRAHALIACNCYAVFTVLDVRF